MEEKQGWVKIYRKILDNPIVCKDSETFSVWIYLLLNATHNGYEVIFKGKRIKLKSGQLITGRESISKKLKINESKVQRILKLFENEQQIEQQTSKKNRLITIVNWDLYQDNEQQIEQQVNNKRTTSEQQVNTNKNVKNNKNDNNVKNNINSPAKAEPNIPYKDIVEYLNFKSNSNYKYTTRKTKDLIKARLNEGFTCDDFKIVIDNKCLEWLNTDMEKYLRPETLFGTKFESYLNQKHKITTKDLNIDISDF